MSKLVISEIAELSSGLGLVNPRLSDLRDRKFGQQGRWSYVTDYLRKQNVSGGNFRASDNWRQYQITKGVNQNKPLSEGRIVFYDTSSLD